MIETHYVAIFAVLLLAAWIGGWYFAARNCRQVSENYGNLLAQVDNLKTQYQKLLDDYMTLREHNYRLETQYKQALQEIARLSADLDAIKKQNLISDE